MVPTYLSQLKTVVRNKGKSSLRIKFLFNKVN